MTISKNEERPFPRALVLQMGARRGYELARMLESRHALAALHTSGAWLEGEGPSRLFRLFSGVSDGVIARRTVRGIPSSKVHSSFRPEVLGKLMALLGASNQYVYRIQNQALACSVRRRGLSGASVLLNTTGNGGADFLLWAQERGLRIATDIVITPRVFEVLSEEQRNWPGWEKTDSVSKEAELFQRHIEDVVDVSDLLLSPSETVDDGLETVKTFDASKLVRLPYALGAYSLIQGNPVPHRILFAGHAGLRKGLPYLAEAARLLRPKGYDIRVAGAAPAEVLERPEVAALTFLGHLGPDEMTAEYHAADIFCLPSLAEGMASVTLEALACGLPCVVTRAAGSPVRHGHDGLVVPERDGPAIAEAIRAISEDRRTRMRMSNAALTTASVHTLDAIGDQLFSILADLVQNHA